MQFKLNRIFFAFLFLLFVTCNRDDCKDITCLYGSLYQEPYKECKCVCNEGWYGINCEKMTEAKVALNISSKFIGVWNANFSESCGGSRQICDNIKPPYTSTVEIDTIGTKIKFNTIILNFYKFENNKIIYGYESNDGRVSEFLELDDSTGEFNYHFIGHYLPASISKSINGKR